MNRPSNGVRPVVSLGNCGVKKTCARFTTGAIKSFFFCCFSVVFPSQQPRQKNVGIENGTREKRRDIHLKTMLKIRSSLTGMRALFTYIYIDGTTHVKISCARRPLIEFNRYSRFVFRAIAIRSRRRSFAGCCHSPVSNRSAGKFSVQSPFFLTLLQCFEHFTAFV